MAIEIIKSIDESVVGVGVTQVGDTLSIDLLWVDRKAKEQVTFATLGDYVMPTSAIDRPRSRILYNLVLKKTSEKA